MAITQNGVYRFTNKAYAGALNVYTDGRPSSGTNVCLYPVNTADAAQKWRAVYAGESYAGKNLFWLNTESGGKYSNFALDRFTGSSNLNNADVYESDRRDCLARDQLVYFDNDQSSVVRIRLFSDGCYLTARSGTNGNVYWTTSNLGTAQQWNVTQVEPGAPNPNVEAKFLEKHYYENKGNSSYDKYVGECVWYCKGRVYEATKKLCPIDGNANTWYATAVNLELKVSDEPRAHSVACFGGGQYGHVAFVESVSSSRIWYTEANFYTKPRLSNGQLKAEPIGNDGSLQDKPRADFEGLYEPFQGYIYF